MSEGRKVSIAEAKHLASTNPNISILWRPDETVSEEQQFAIIFNE